MSAGLLQGKPGWLLEYDEGKRTASKSENDLPSKYNYSHKYFE